MAESYIPEDTNVICTLQTIPSPLMIKQYREQAFTVHDAKDKPLLNILDKKISGPFECLNAGTFLGGLMTLCLGIAIGALIVAAILAATIATGGLALVALGIALVACGIGIGAGIVALCKIPHACDVTLSSQWIDYHPDVTIEGQNALLNKSYIQCSGGGLVNLIMSPAIAQAAAQKIGDHNMNYFHIHLSENFIQGILASPLLNNKNKAEMIAGPVVAVITYCMFEDDLNDHKQPDTNLEKAWDSTWQGVVGDAMTDAAKTMGGDNTGSFTRGLSLYLYGAGHNAVGRAAGSNSDELLGAALHGLGKNQMKTNMYTFAGGLAVSIGFGIWKNIEHNAARKDSQEADEADNANEISVVAVNV